GLGLLPAGVVHDEAQPTPARARGGAAGARADASSAGSGARAGSARADVEPSARARRDRGPAARIAAAVGGLSGRARGRPADTRVPRRSWRRASEGTGTGHGARDEPRDGDDGGT